MADTDLPTEDEVLRRMLATPPEKHKPLGKREERPDVDDSLHRRS